MKKGDLSGRLQKIRLEDVDFKRSGIGLANTEFSCRFAIQHQNPVVEPVFSVTQITLVLGIVIPQKLCFPLRISFIETDVEILFHTDCFHVAVEQQGDGPFHFRRNRLHHVGHIPMGAIGIVPVRHEKQIRMYLTDQLFQKKPVGFIIDNLRIEEDIVEQDLAIN